MKKSIYFSAALLLAGGIGLTSCQDDTETVDNRLFDTATENVSTLLLDGKADEVTRTLSVKMAKPENLDVTITYAADFDAVDAFNAIYGEEALPLPAEHFTIPEPTATIIKGAVQSNEVAVKFLGLKSLDTQNLYVLPVSIVNSTVPVLDCDRTTYYVFRGAALINVVGGLKKTCLTFINEGQTPALSGITEFTFEALVYPDAFANTLSTLMGIEGQFLIRIGDAGVPSNQIQLATSSGNATNANWQLEIGKWTFITLTYNSSNGNVEVFFDGISKGTATVGYRGAVNWNVRSSDRACYIGYAYDTDRYFDGKIAEVRVWNKILTTDDIRVRNHFYQADADDENLCGYWKFDEGGGSIVHDYANGYDMQTPATYPGKSNAPDELQWYQITLP